MTTGWKTELSRAKYCKGTSGKVTHDSNVFLVCFFLRKTLTLFCVCIFNCINHTISWYRLISFWLRSHRTWQLLHLSRDKFVAGCSHQKQRTLVAATSWRSKTLARIFRRFTISSSTMVPSQVASSHRLHVSTCRAQIVVTFSVNAALDLTFSSLDYVKIIT